MVVFLRGLYLPYIKISTTENTSLSENVYQRISDNINDVLLGNDDDDNDDDDDDDNDCETL